MATHNSHSKATRDIHAPLKSSSANPQFVFNLPTKRKLARKVNNSEVNIRLQVTEPAPKRVCRSRLSEAHECKDCEHDDGELTEFLASLAQQQQAGTSATSGVEASIEDQSGSATPIASSTAPCMRRWVFPGDDEAPALLQTSSIATKRRARDDEPGVPQDMLLSKPRKMRVTEAIFATGNSRIPIVAHNEEHKSNAFVEYLIDQIRSKLASRPASSTSPEGSPLCEQTYIDPALASEATPTTEAAAEHTPPSSAEPSSSAKMTTEGDTMSGVQSHWTVYEIAPVTAPRPVPSTETAPEETQDHEMVNYDPAQQAEGTFPVSEEGVAWNSGSTSQIDAMDEEEMIDTEEHAIPTTERMEVSLNAANVEPRITDQAQDWLDVDEEAEAREQLFRRELQMLSHANVGPQGRPNSPNDEECRDDEDSNCNASEIDELSESDDQEAGPDSNAEFNSQFYLVGPETPRYDLSTVRGIQMYWTNEGDSFIVRIPVFNYQEQQVSHMQFEYPYLEQLDAFPTNAFCALDNGLFYIIYSSVSMGDFICAHYCQPAFIVEPPTLADIPQNDNATNPGERDSRDEQTHSFNAKHQADAQRNTPPNVRGDHLLLLKDTWTRGQDMIKSILTINNAADNKEFFREVYTHFQPLGSLPKMVQPRLTADELTQIGWHIETLVHIYHNTMDYIHTDLDDALSYGFYDLGTLFEAVGRMLPGGEDPNLWIPDQPPKFVKIAQYEHKKARLSQKQGDDVLDMLSGCLLQNESKTKTDREKLKEAWQELSQNIDVLKADTQDLHQISFMRDLLRTCIKPAITILENVLSGKGATDATADDVQAARYDTWLLWEADEVCKSFHSNELVGDVGVSEAYLSLFQVFQADLNKMRGLVGDILPEGLEEEEEE